MPQFTLTLIHSQLFWLCLCFLVLYFFMSRICLPRIAEILKAREETIEKDSVSAASLQEKIDQINEHSQNLKSNSVQQYQLSIEQASKQAILDREKALGKLRKEIDKMTHESETKISNFIKDSKSDCDNIVEILVKSISNKILN
ncbi:MAG: hypothetical protein O3B09_01365 [Proteobacteria bacterium]|nr:hypothetical protein [Pseudomonadota bacterium]